MIRAAVFDLDGVVLDSMSIWKDLGARYLLRRGLTPEPGLGELLFAMSMEQGADYLRTHYPLPESADVLADLSAMLRDYYYNEVPEKDGARTALAFLRDRGVSVTAATRLAAEEAGADAISMINTLTGIAVDVNKRRMVLANNTGGLSGPAVRPVALRMVWQSAKKVHIPIIGMGGIETGEDAAAFMLCGAKAVMVGTANFTDPFACPRIIRELDAYCDRQKVQRAQELVGTLAEY